MIIVTADHADDLAGMRIDRHERCLDLRHLLKLDLKSLCIVVYLFDEKLGEHSRLDFFPRSLPASAHVILADHGFKSSETHTSLVRRSIDLRDQAFYVFAFFILIAVPIGMLISGQSLDYVVR